MLIQPAQKDAVLLADIESAGPQEGLMHLWWLGQSGFLVQHRGRRFLFDPYLSDSLTQKYADSDKPHIRMTERCVDPAQLTGLEFVTASHIHTDHLDAETLLPLARANGALRLFLPGPIVDEAKRRLGSAAIEFIEHSDGDEYHTPHWHLTGVASAHNELKTDDRGRHHYIGFILKAGHFTLYHSGDTLWHDGLVETLRKHRCDLMLLPINGNRPERRVSGNLNGTEAAALAKACGARLVVPCHYDMFTFNTAAPDEEFVPACQRLGQPFHVMRCGERLTLNSR